MYMIGSTTAYLLMLAGSALAGRAMGIATVNTGILLTRRLFYRGRHRPRLAQPLEENDE